MLKKYKYNFLKKHTKLSKNEREAGTYIHKEFFINEIHYIILKHKNSNKRDSYKCKYWDNRNWTYFDEKNNPREALNTIKKHSQITA